MDMNLDMDIKRGAITVNGVYRERVCLRAFLWSEAQQNCRYGCGIVWHGAVFSEPCCSTFKVYIIFRSRLLCVNQDGPKRLVTVPSAMPCTCSATKASRSNNQQTSINEYMVPLYSSCPTRQNSIYPMSSQIFPTNIHHLSSKASMFFRATAKRR